MYWALEQIHHKTQMGKLVYAKGSGCVNNPETQQHRHTQQLECWQHTISQSC